MAEQRPASFSLRFHSFALGCSHTGPGSPHRTEADRWKNRAMHEVMPDADDLREWLGAESPGADAILGHVVNTRHGRCWADRWPAPSALLAETAGNFILRGTAAAIDPAELRPLVQGFVDAPDSFDGLLDEAFPGHVRWDRIVYRLDLGSKELELSSAAGEPMRAGSSALVRFLDADDSPAVEALHPDVKWVAGPWGGPTGLAASGQAVGAFIDERLVAVASTFFLGVRHDEIAVGTEPEFRRRGFSTSCARLLTARSVAAGRVPSWTTSLDNAASRRVAERIGFEFVRFDALHVIGVDVPGSGAEAGDDSD